MKINITFFVRNEVLNIFYMTIFLRTIFEETGRWTPKMNVTFSMGNGVPNIVSEFFPRKSPYWLSESGKTGFGAHFLKKIDFWGSYLIEDRLIEKKSTALGVGDWQLVPIVHWEIKKYTVAQIILIIFFKFLCVWFWIS